MSEWANRRILTEHSRDLIGWDILLILVVKIIFFNFDETWDKLNHLDILCLFFLYKLTKNSSEDNNISDEQMYWIFIFFIISINIFLLRNLTYQRRRANCYEKNQNQNFLRITKVVYPAFKLFLIKNILWHL